MRRAVMGLIFLILPYILVGQTRNETGDWFADYIEDVLSFLAEEGGGDNIEYILQQISDLVERPLRLNDDLDVLEDIGLITDVQHLAYRDHIESTGKLIVIYELQAIEGWDMATIRRVSPLLRSTRDLDQLNVSGAQLWQQLHTDLVAYASRRYPESRGYISQDGNPPTYEGNPWRHYVLLRMRYQYRISAGLALEKDAGESLFKGSNSTYDHTSFHLYWQKVNTTIETVAIGDYRLNIGQGLILHNGFGGNKSGMVHQVKKGGRYVRPHTSTSEINFFRGAAADFNIGKRWKAAAFFSLTNEDGNLVSPTDTTDLETAEFFTSLQTSGLHRTAAEREDEGQARQTVVGGRLGYQHRRWIVDFNAVQYRFDQPLQPRVQPYNQFRFAGDQLTNLSIDYAYQHSSFTLWGESAMSDNGALAHVVGLQTGLSKQIYWSTVFRSYPRDYQVINPNAFGERRNAENEVGIYNAMSYDFHPRMKLSGYVDIWQNPWLAFNVDAPGDGREYLLRFDYKIKRHVLAYAQFFHETRSQGQANAEGFDGIQDRRRNRLRLHLDYQASRKMKWRSRAEWSFTDFEDGQEYAGYLLYQDLIYGSLEFPLSFTSRFMIFNIEDFESRIFAYENNLLYNFLIPGFNGTGYRYYINLRYRPMKPLTIEMRWAQTVFRDGDTIGSGQEERQGRRLGELAFQVRYSFN